MKTTRTLIALAILFSHFATYGQSPVQEFIANYISRSTTVNNNTSYPSAVGSFSSCSGSLFNHTWSNGSNNLLQISSFNANSKTYVVADLDSAIVKLRRVNNASVSGIRNIVYAEATVSPTTACPSPNQLNFKTPYTDDMTEFLTNRVLNQGTDNLFTNSGNGDGNNNNIERVDVIFPNGISSSITDEAGFLFCERGNNLAHDGFRIAPILSLDANNDPASFGSVKTCTRGNGSNNGSWGHPALSAGNLLLSVNVLRKDAAETYLRPSAAVNQEIGGVFFSFTDLGIAANQVVYGYALLGPDGTANPTSAQLLNINDAAVYPTATTEAQGGGLDLIAVNTFFATAQVLATDIRINIKGKVQQDNAFLEWEINNLNEEAMVTLERSVNSTAFSEMYIYNALHDGKNSYKDDPAPNLYFYRLKILSASGKLTYSRVVKINMIKHSNWKLYPTFIRNGETITFEGLPDGFYEAQILSMSSLVLKKELKIERGKGMLQLTISGGVPGIYVISLNRNGEPVGNGNKIGLLKR
jgi:hypothetical protein